jgi:hypothetical protein
MSIAERCPSCLTFDCLVLDEEGWSDFYSKVGDFVIGNLELFSWCGNLISFIQFLNFSRFLSNQPALIHLNLSNCLPVSENVVAFLTDLTLQKPLRHLELRGRKPYVFGSGLLPVLESLHARATIRSLDITGQAIGDGGLDLVAQLAERCLDDLRFDGSKPSSHEAFLATTARIASSRLPTREWPQEDANMVIALIPLSNRLKVVTRIDAMRQQFEARMRVGSSKMPADLVALLREGGVVEEVQRVDPRLFTFQDPAMARILANALAGGEKTDPLVVAAEQLEQEAEIDALLAKLESAQRAIDASASV